MAAELDKTYRAVVDSPVGPLLIIGTDTHIIEISFQDDMPPVDVNVSTIVSRCVEELEEYIKGNLKKFTVPLLQPGTSFQQGVWKLLLDIDFGKTISYMQLAVQSGDAKNTRAVANANGKNNLAIIVPCHRVIGSNRDLTGYAGGLHRKRWLLDHELKYAHGVRELF